jgi:hypothetical protein
MLELFGTVILGSIAICFVGAAVIFAFGCAAGIKQQLKK